MATLFYTSRRILVRLKEISLAITLPLPVFCGGNQFGDHLAISTKNQIFLDLAYKLLMRDQISTNMDMALNGCERKSTDVSEREPHNNESMNIDNGHRLKAR
jgi:hypothetical protein